MPPAAAAGQDNINEHHEDLNGRLFPDECFWRDHQSWLKERGYMLRPRYMPDWTPSWEGTDDFYWEHEDGIWIRLPQIIDATRLSDGAMVALKRISTTNHPHELEINQSFSTEPLASDPRNHCVPIYESLHVPDIENTVLLVMPLLRKFHDPEIETVGEAVEFFRQVFQGLQFMHERHVAHRDCMNLNIMMDPKPLFPRMYHPQRTSRSLDLKRRAKHHTRTDHPVRYYLIDFGISRKYNLDDGPPLEDPIWGGDKTVPEFHRSDDPCDPFPTDVYYLGNMIREDFLHVTRGLEFIQPLVQDMVNDDPTRRPAIDQVVDQFSSLVTTLGYWKLRSRVVRTEDHWIVRFYKNIRHIFRTIRYIVTSRPPIPTA